MTVFSDPSRIQSDLCNFSEDLTSHTEDINILGLVADLILTLLGCIVLKIDHIPNTTRYKELLSDSALNILRNDLENLLRFETKDLNSLLLDISRIRSTKKNRDAHDSTFKICDKDHTSGEEGKFLLRRTVLSVMGFLIFRRSKKSFVVMNNSSMNLSNVELVSFHSNETVTKKVMSTDTYVCQNSFEENNNVKDICKTEPTIRANDTYMMESPFGQTYLNDFSLERIFIQHDSHSTMIDDHITTEMFHNCILPRSSTRSNTRRQRSRRGIFFGTYKKIKKMYAAGICKKCSMPLVPLKGTKLCNKKYKTWNKIANSSTISNLEICESENFDNYKSKDTNHVCSKIYCPLCYGWLWMPIYYSFLLIYPAIIDITYNSLTRYQNLITFANFSKY